MSYGSIVVGHLRVLTNIMLVAATQAERLLACSFRPPKPKRARAALLKQTKSAPSVPVPESNVGNQLLRGLGWQKGQGLGASQSGIVEPLLPERRTGRRGLGC